MYQIAIVTILVITALIVWFGSRLVIDVDKAGGNGMVAAIIIAAVVTAVIAIAKRLGEKSTR